jgi:hypothetical protein
MGADLDSMLFGHSGEAAEFATAETLISCCQYLEPILRGENRCCWDMHPCNEWGMVGGSSAVPAACSTLGPYQPPDHALHIIVQGQNCGRQLTCTGPYQAVWLLLCCIFACPQT